jgi:arylsulfatase A-like enzyme
MRASPFDDKGGLALASGALRFMEAADPRPAFVFLNLLEAHMPYAPPERFLRPLGGSGFTRDQLLRIRHAPLQGLVPGSEPNPRDLEGLRLLYRAEIAYDDDLLGRLLDRLREAGRLDRTIVVVVGDHGESLGDHPPLDHQLGLWDALVRVPLIVRFPPRMQAGVIAPQLVSLTDVFPALVELAGLHVEPRGGPIVDTSRRDAVFMAYDRPLEILDKIRHDLGVDPAPWNRRLDAVRTRDAKWIVGSDGSQAAFDLDGRSRRAKQSRRGGSKRSARLRRARSIAPRRGRRGVAGGREGCQADQ